MGNEKGANIHVHGWVGGGAPARNPGGTVGCEQDISLSFGPLSLRSLRNGALGQGAVSGSCWQGRQNSELHCGGEMSKGKVLLVQSHTGSVTTSLLGSRAPLQKHWGYWRGVGGAPLVDFQGQPKPREATLGSSPGLAAKGTPLPTGSLSAGGFYY